MRRALSPSFLAAAGFIECLDAAPDESVTGKEQRNSEREEQTGRHVAYNQRKKEREKEIVLIREIFSSSAHRHTWCTSNAGDGVNAVAVV